MALHIVKLAEKAGIPVVENIEVARALAAKPRSAVHIRRTIRAGGADSAPSHEHKL
ncbi:hypothetical protein [Chromobacterium sphagni]|uniref:hypothetical protein n=1 Tax=Chromobacterium sphagni TaxID=1903179 RepID=UPI003B98029E